MGRVCQSVALIFLLLVLGCAADKEAKKGEADAAYKLGLAFLSEDRPTRALTELTKARDLAPDDPKVHNLLGLAYWIKKETTLAEESLRRAVELDPGYSDAWNNLGALYIDQGRFEAAIPALEAAVKNVFYHTPERALTNLGWALYKTGRTEEAEKRYRESLDHAADFPLTYRNLAVLLQSQGRYEDALDSLDKALVGIPNDAETHLLRGVSLLKMGRRGEARDSFQEAWALAPGTDLGRSAKTYLELLQ